MFDYIISFLRPKKTLYHFNNEFRKGYKNAWIDNIKNYSP